MIALEDNLLNLQTMGGSRFAMAYMDDIRSWEKKLNHVMEVIDIWFKVQMKWRDLEPVFIGAEDIRQQLPEEAKRFDKINKTFKDIMTASSKKGTSCIEATHAPAKLGTICQIIRDDGKNIRDDGKK